MADTHITTKVDILHPLTTLHCEHCHTWRDYQPTHCAVLNGTVAILTEKGESNDVLHISSTDLHSWTSTTLPYQHMSLATYKSQFVAVGGKDRSKEKPTDRVFTSDAGLKWQPSLPRMKTKRFRTSSVGTTSPDVLVVVGGCRSDYSMLEDVEVLVEGIWQSVCPLPKHCCNMSFIFYQEELVFTDRFYNSIYSCSIATLISSHADYKYPSIWNRWKALGAGNTTIFHFSRLVNINANGIIKCYCSTSQSWVDATIVGNKITFSSYNSAAAALPNGDIVVARKEDGIHRVKVSVSSFDPDSKFVSNVLSRLEAVMGIKVASVLANKTSQLTTSSGVKLQTQNDCGVEELSLPDPQKDPVQYVEEVILQWSKGHGHRPPTWKQLLHTLQDIGLIELSQQIEAFLKDMDKARTRS